MSDLGIGLAVFGGIVLLFVFIAALKVALTSGAAGAIWVAMLVSGGCLLITGLCLALKPVGR